MYYESINCTESKREEELNQKPHNNYDQRNSVCNFAIESISQLEQFKTQTNRIEWLRIQAKSIESVSMFSSNRKRNIMFILLFTRFLLFFFLFSRLCYPFNFDVLSKKNIQNEWRKKNIHTRGIMFRERATWSAHICSMGSH